MGLGKERCRRSRLFPLPCAEGQPGSAEKEIGSGNFRWANNATLADTGIVAAGREGSFTYNRAAFNPDGSIKAES